METLVFCFFFSVQSNVTSQPDRKDKVCLTGQIPNQSGHCLFIICIYKNLIYIALFIQRSKVCFVILLLKGYL